MARMAVVALVGQLHRRLARESEEGLLRHHERPAFMHERLNSRGRGRLSGLTGSARRLLEAGVESIEGLFHPADVFRARAGVRGLGVGFGELAEGHQPVVQRLMSLALHRAA